jgi:hypothetical protein
MFRARLPLLVAAVLAVCPPAFAQSPTAVPDTPAAAPASPTVEIDQSLINLPTTLPLKAGRSYFRLTHRFARDLGQGDFGSLADDLFSLDNGAVMGLEYRYGVTSRVQAGVHRSTLGKTLQVFGRADLLRPATAPVSLSALVSLEGQSNLRQDPQPGVAVLLSRAVGTRLVVYAAPTYVHDAHTETLRLLHEGHAHDLGDAEDEDESSTSVDTVYVGLGARARLRETVTATFEVSPRLGGYAPDAAVWGAGIEKLTRGHVLQLNVGNSFSTTPGMIARGGARHEVYLGFNLSRKF